MDSLIRRQRANCLTRALNDAAADSVAPAEDGIDKTKWILFQSRSLKGRMR